MGRGSTCLSGRTSRRRDIWRERGSGAIGTGVLYIGPWWLGREYLVIVPATSDLLALPVPEIQTRISNCCSKGGQKPTEASKQQITTRYLGHVTGYRPVKDRYFLIRSLRYGSSPAIIIYGPPCISQSLAIGADSISSVIPNPSARARASGEISAINLLKSPLRELAPPLEISPFILNRATLFSSLLPPFTIMTLASCVKRSSSLIFKIFLINSTSVPEPPLNPLSTTPGVTCCRRNPMDPLKFLLGSILVAKSARYSIATFIINTLGRFIDVPSCNSFDRTAHHNNFPVGHCVYILGGGDSVLCVHSLYLLEGNVVDLGISLTWHCIPFSIPNWYQHPMNPIILSIHHQLGKYHHEISMNCPIGNPILLRLHTRGIDHNLIPLSIIRCRCLHLHSIVTGQKPTEASKQQITTRYLGHVTGYRPVKDRYFLIRSGQKPTEASKQQITTRYLGHVTGYRPVKDRYFLIRSKVAFFKVKFFNQGTGGELCNLSPRVRAPKPAWLTRGAAKTRGYRALRRGLATLGKVLRRHDFTTLLGIPMKTPLLAYATRPSYKGGVENARARDLQRMSNPPVPWLKNSTIKKRRPHYSYTPITFQNPMKIQLFNSS
eukprot:sb/3463155/